MVSVSTPVFVALILILAPRLGRGYAALIVLVLALSFDIPIALSNRRRHGRE